MMNWLQSLFGNKANRFQEVLEAIRNDDLLSVKRILMKDPSLVNEVDHKNCNFTLFFYATGSKDKEIARFIFSLKPDIDHKDSLGTTYLHDAAGARLVDIAEELIKAGIDPNSMSSTGRLPLHEAIKTGSIEMVELLLKYGAKINIIGKYYPPIVFAATCCQLEVLKLLLNKGADPNLHNPGDHSALVYAPDQRKDIQQALINAGAKRIVAD